MDACVNTNQWGVYPRLLDPKSWRLDLPLLRASMKVDGAWCSVRVKGPCQAGRTKR